ncbi:hypothetical protein P280DRAFT_466009 [Massarina eburnea CBS 473.64]|uniref:Uncharacterized protein n=1 Tax=Massarina eburnea CBS 473.64 TaxID=1395130 RepID=A0A6A6SES1_9PLEO|nr:hypothetical protein P280DRAFT_466009 [Massarina eburnea CBS 473.64]
MPTSEPENSSSLVARKGFTLEPTPTDMDIKFPRRTKPTYCGCDIPLDQANLEDAIKELHTQAGLDNGQKQIPGAQSLYAIRGNVVAFLCNTNPQQSKGVWAREDMVKDTLSVLNYRCGYGIAGSYDELPGLGLVTGWMRMDSPETDFCNLARKSKTDTCPTGDMNQG